MPVSRSLLARGFVRVLAATAVALSVITLAGQVLQLRMADAEGTRGVIIAIILITLLSGPAAAVLALALAWRSWDRNDARALATFLALTAFVLSGDGVWWLMTMARAPEWLRSVTDLSIPVCALAGMTAMLRFSCSFPRPLTPAELADGGSRARRVLAAAQRRSLDAAAVRRVATGSILGLILVPESIRIVAEVVGRPLPNFTLLKYIVFGMLLSSMAVSALNLRAGYRGADADGRRRIYWVLEGFLLATGIAVLASLLKVLQDATGYVPPLRFWYGLSMMAAFAALLACVAIAMFYAGALDPALAIRRTAVAGLVGVAMVVTFATLEQVLQGYLGQWLGLSDRVGGILTGVGVGLTFEPLRTRTATFVEGVLARWTSAPSPASSPTSAPVLEAGARVEPA
ncbi:hypothetical protein [Longimicrobium sp.]|uniref:hypothetical protein n=1 Tax=Longimicrobium sp. TaxID=2029185 RepID=UPI002E32071A|nr:hypothetical protein [Longimicrobium sp.]HEX6036496.1 hypothetical protein [Longimicrobium sp.]